MLLLHSKKVSGYGLALVGTTVEQDAAYWEIHGERMTSNETEILCGVSTKKDQKFYNALHDQNEGTFYYLYSRYTL
jgi:hypothetical protein